MNITRCLRQIHPVTLKIGGVGDCKTCTPDPENNPKCKMYYPITILIVEVSEGNMDFG